MKIERVTLREIHLKLVHYFETSFGRTDLRRILLVEIESDGRSGWGECVAGEGPFFSSETIDTAWLILTQFILPRTVGRSVSNPGEFPPSVQSIRGHPMAKASVEAALWDLKAQEEQVPLWKLLGGTRQKIPCGVSIGIQENPQILLEKIEQELASGYRKIKIKVKPGWDTEIVRLVRRHFPEIDLSVDANSAYGPADTKHLAELDAFNLLNLEQPLAYDDLFDHARLQAQIQTPIGLDESIRHAADAAHACELKAGRMINIKMGRVGGTSEAKRIHDLCSREGIPVWCGGMLESGIGRAHNIALSTLENFSVPGDVSASKRYFERDTICPAVEVTPDGYIIPPQSPGLGYNIDRAWIERITARTERFVHKHPFPLPPGGPGM